MRKKIVVAGHICLDITPVFPNKKISKISDVLIPGKLIWMDGVHVIVVSNTGLGLKVLGADVELMGKIGNDAFGNMVMHVLEEYNAAESMIISENAVTSYSVVLALPGLDRVFLHNPGANDFFYYEDLNLEVIKKASLFHFGYPPLMHSMFEKNGLELIKIMKAVKGMGVATSLDMAAVDSNADAGKADWEAIIRGVLPYVDFFVPSVEELAFMIDRQRYDEWRLRAGDKDITMVLKMEDIKPLADKLFEWGAKVVLIKCGVMGMYFNTGRKERINEIGGNLISNIDAWTGQEHFEASYVPEQVLSGTGAGDTSIAAFLFAVTENYSWEECLKLATATGTSCVEAYDAISGLHSFEELMSKIENGWAKQ